MVKEGPEEIKVEVGHYSYEEYAKLMAGLGLAPDGTPLPEDGGKSA